MASVCGEATTRIGIKDLIEGKPKERKKVLKEIGDLLKEISPSDLGNAVVTKTIDFYSPLDGISERPVEIHNNHVRCGVTRDFICRT